MKAPSWLKISWTGSGNGKTPDGGVCPGLERSVIDQAIIPIEVKPLAGQPKPAFNFQGLIPDDRGHVPQLDMEVIMTAWRNTMEQRLKVAVERAAREGVGVLVVREATAPRVEGDMYHAGISHTVEPSALVPRETIVYVDKEALDAFTDKIMRDGFKFHAEGTDHETDH